LQKFLTFVSSIRWQDLLDIAFNSYILFRLYALFRGTDAFRVLIGIAFLWVLQRMAVSMGLILTSWMMEGIIAVAALIVIVVFRNEIRSVFRARNIWTILWGLPQKQTKTPVEMITESVYTLAQQRIGALIVLPGREDIDEVVQGGIRWNGKISTEMIKSIFWPNNPVHDGAAVIRGDRVTEVSVILPLSQRRDLPTVFGTRHRAAAGLSEVTDALVIAVSEERGTVTVAQGSDLRTIHTEKDLNLVLKRHLGIREDQTSYVKKRRIELAAAGLASLLIVSTVWFSISRGFDAIKTFDIPIEYANRDPNLELLNTSATSVKVYVVGSRALLRSIRPEQIRVRIDLSRTVPGTNTFAITDDHLSIPPGLSLKEIRPMVVEVTLDERARKMIPVQADWTGKLPARLILVRAAITPPRLEVVGARSVLEQTATIYTAPIPLNDIAGSGKTEARVVVPSSFLALKSGSKDKVVVTYDVRERELK
jgi:diadenylate cyclase